MRFKNKGTGKIYTSMYDAYVEHCDNRVCNSDCAMHVIEFNCANYANLYPVETANLLGYEVIQDDNTESKITEDKPIEDWTIRELMVYCENQGKCSSTCKFYNDSYRESCILHDNPARWDFNLKPKYTDDEIKRVKLIRELLPSVVNICRDHTGMLYYELSNNTEVYVPSHLFPSIKPDSFASATDIIESESK